MFNLSDVGLQSLIILLVLGAGILLSCKRRTDREIFPISVTQELKGFAILLVIFSHVGNFLIHGGQFLSPMSHFSQAGVDLFLLLSGYGLTVSNIKRPQKPLAFYKRLLKLFVPFWLLLIALLLIDFLVLDRTYTTSVVAQAFAGIFLQSDMGRSLNAPFWFITAITFYYLIYPLLFSKKRPWLSALAVFGIGAGIVMLSPPVLGGVMFLYKLHYVAFPAGMLLAWLITGTDVVKRLPARLTGLGSRSRWLVAALLLASLFLINPHGHAGKNAVITQALNMSFALVLLAIFIIKPISSTFLMLIGVYSFEIYLLHWPLMSRYNLLYGHIPGWAATLIYLGIALGLSYVLQALTNRILPSKAK